MEACAALELPGVHPVIREPAGIPKGVRVGVHLTHYRSPTSLFLRCKLTGLSDTEGQDDFNISPSTNHVDDAFIGMSCLVCQDSSGRLALRALVTDVHRDPSGVPFKVGVLYVDSGRTDVVELDCVYTIDAESAAQPQKAIACSLRSVKPTTASSPFDLKPLWKRSTHFEAVFYTASDTGVFQVDLYAKCHEEKARLKTYDVRTYLVQNGFAKLVGYLSDTPEAVQKSTQGVVSVSRNNGEGTQNGTTERPSHLLPTCSEPTDEAPRGSRSAVEAAPTASGQCDAEREDENGPLCSNSINTEDPSVPEPNVGARRGCSISRFYAPQGLRSPAHPSEPVIDPVKPLRPPEVGSCVLGQVSAVVSPSCFYIVFPYGRRSIERLSMDGMGRKSRETLESLTKDLQDACNRGSLPVNRRVMRAQGELVAAKSNLDGRWYRARVVSLEEGDTLKVFYMDIGFCESLRVDQVKTLQERFTQLPQQALQACLVTDKANNEIVNKPAWDTQSCEAFANCVSGKDLVVKIVCVAQGLLHVRLFFTDGEQLCSVRRCLRNACNTEPN